MATINSGLRAAVNDCAATRLVIDSCSQPRVKSGSPDVYVTKKNQDFTDNYLDNYRSYFELKKTPKTPRGMGRNIENDPHYYGVSSFLKKEIVEQIMKFPNPKKKMAVGYVYCEGGPQDTNDQHVCWWLYEGADVSGFELMGEKNGE